MLWAGAKCSRPFFLCDRAWREAIWLAHERELCQFAIGSDR